MRFKKISLFICVHLWFISLGFFSVTAQVRPVNDYGALGLGQLLKRLNTTASVMMIGAHPDDEDSALLAYLARGESARTAYLSLTRGDGGQNIIGPELGEALGVLRTEELLQARRLDGAEQYFTRAYDYGFSKTLTEAKSKWPEEVIKCDVVRTIRLFRPMVVISRFTGTPADGHGQHQYAGYISPIAVKAAADPQQCTDAGTPWQVLKFYVEQSFGDTSQPTLKINTGQYDPMLGRSYFEIAMEGRSMHRSQGEGRLELHGDQFSGLKLVEAAKDRRELRIFDGLDVSPRKLFPTVADSLRQALSSDATKVLPLLTKAHEALIASRTQSYVFFDGMRVEAEITEAIKLAAGIQIDALANSETVVPGEGLFVAVKSYVPQNSALHVNSVELSVPPKWQVTRVASPKENNSAVVRRETAAAADYFNISVPSGARPTQPYWLLSRRKGDLYEWPDADYLGLPFQPSQIVARVKVDIDGTEVTFDQPVQYRFADPARGEVRREINLVPALSVSLDKKLVVVSETNVPSKLTLTMSLTNNSPNAIEGVRGVSINPAFSFDGVLEAGQFSLSGKDEKKTITVNIPVPKKAKVNTYYINASALAGGESLVSSMNTLSYPHIQAHRYYTQATTEVEILDLKTIPAKIGYIMGSGDEVPEAVRQMGMEVTMLEEKDLASGDLSKFDTIVVGIRASETRPDMMANKQRLLDYVSNGGNLIMQYQRGNFAQSGLAPYPIDTKDKQGTTAGDVGRVVDENAAVKILEPANPIFNFPNKITDEDFKGWVQERNAYNLVTFDPKYTPLLESHDAGEQENKGGLVIAKVGKGNWDYCSYSFFRQLPAGVPGAYRLFDNLLSLSKAK